MKKVMLVGLVLATMSGSLLAAEHNFELTYFATTKHIESQLNSTTEYNSNHNFIGLEYRAGDHGYSISSFTNSYYNQSYLIDYVQYWKLSNDIEFSARAGGVTGYGSHYDYCGKVCPFVSVGVSYTASNYVIPKLSFAPGVFILSFSMRF